MIVKYCRIQDLEKALQKLNKRYKGNIIFKRLEGRGRNVFFTLTVKSSKELGARRGQSGRRIAAACWHAHGHYFEEIFKICPGAEIISRAVGAKITQHQGNWQDTNIGSVVEPLYFSEACDCGR